MEIKICDVIKKKRTELSLNQEQLAVACGVSVQAVSKWENEKAFPDIVLLPVIAEFLKLDMNELFFGENRSEALAEIPDDGKLRIVQFIGAKIVAKEEAANVSDSRPLCIKFPEERSEKLEVEIWGGANIGGAVNGSVKAGGGVNCGPVADGVEAGGGVNCGPVNGNVEAGVGVNCGPVSGNVEAGVDVNCDDVSGDVTAHKVKAKKIEGNVYAEKIKGNVNAEKEEAEAEKEEFN